MVETFEGPSATGPRVTACARFAWRRVWAIFADLAALGAGRRSVHRASVAAAAILIGACTGARAGTGPCKPDQFNGLTCGEGPGAARVIEGTMSPSKQIAFAWREPGKPPTEEPDIYQVESMLLWLYSGTALAISPGDLLGHGHGARESI